MDATLSLDIATLAAILLTGAALAIFALLTYRLSKQVMQLRYSPVLEICPVGSPKAGSFDEKKLRYYGVKWEIYLMNPGDVPIWAEDIGVFLKVTPSRDSREDVLTGVGKLCELLDEEGNELADRAMWVNGHSQRRMGG